MEAKRLNIRLFLEGIEVPVVSAAVSSVPDNPLEISIQIPATDESTGLIERTMFHVYYYDPQPEDKLVGDEYKLFCMGETTGFQFAKSENQRSIVLTSMDFSVYWDTTYLFNATGMGKEGRVMQSFCGANASVVSGGTSIFPDGGSTGFSKLAKVINGRPASFPKMKGLMGGIVHLLEKVGGFYRGSRVYKGFNDYTSLAELRVKLMQQIHAASGDNTSALLFKRKTLQKWVKNSIASSGSMETFNGVSKKLLALIFHRRQSIPAPPYFPGKQTKNKKKKTYYSTKGVSGYKLANDVEAFIREMEVIVGLTLGNWKSSLSKAVNGYGKLAKKSREYASVAKTKGAPEQAQKFLSAARWLDRARDHSQSSNNTLSSAAKTADSVYMRNLLASSVYLYTPIAYARKAVAAVRGLRQTRQKKSRTVSEVEYERVGTHVFKPDIFFTAPPCCNVLFPDQYRDFTWARNYLAEPTRLMLRGGGNRTGDIFGHSKYSVYFAPDIPSVRGSIKLSSKKFAKHIFDHELYSGIIPAQMQIPWAKIYKIAVEGSKKKYTYMQRLANFEYVKQHYASRTGVITGKFNPGFLPGFPALVIDKPLTKHQLEQYNKPLAEAVKGLQLEGVKDIKTKADLLDRIVSPQYLVFPQQVSHVINQEGGVTTYNVVMVRDHRETTKKLGISTVDAYTKTISKTTTWLALIYGGWSSKKYRLGPLGRKILSARKLESAPKLGYSYWTPLRVSVMQEPLHDDGGKPVAGGWVREVWNPDSNRRQREHQISGDLAVYRLTEQVAVVGKTEIKKDLGPEYAITPPWMARVWHPCAVGNTYQEMFGTSSIMDDVGLVVGEELATAWRQDTMLQARMDRNLPAQSVDPYVAVDNKDTESRN